MSSCPVCYESYCLDAESTASPRKLGCGDIICLKCIKSEICDSTFYCPECGAEFKGDSPSAFSFYFDPANVVSGEEIPPPAVDEKSIVPDRLSDLVEKSYNSLGSGDGDSERLSKLFSIDHHSVEIAKRESIQRSPCQHEGCTNKAIGGGYCLNHSKNVMKTMAEANMIAEDMMTHSDVSRMSISGTTLIRRQVHQNVGIPMPKALIQRFKLQERLELGEAFEILDRAKEILSKEPNIIRVDAPVVAVGDIHGQFFDLLNLLDEAGEPGKQDSDIYLFLGDYVDRGSFSCEVIFLILVLKINFPDKVFLLRGNHECGSITGHFGFKQECKQKYGVNGE